MIKIYTFTPLYSKNYNNSLANSLSHCHQFLCQKSKSQVCKQVLLALVFTFRLYTKTGFAILVEQGRWAKYKVPFRKHSELMVYCEAGCNWGWFLCICFSLGMSRPPVEGYLSHAVRPWSIFFHYFSFFLSITISFYLSLFLFLSLYLSVSLSPFVFLCLPFVY